VARRRAVLNAAAVLQSDQSLRRVSNEGYGLDQPHHSCLVKRGVVRTGTLSPLTLVGRRVWRGKEQVSLKPGRLADRIDKVLSGVIFDGCDRVQAEVAPARPECK
jgi:hypothetical protein